MSNINKQIKKLGWVAEIIHPTTDLWLSFSSGNTAPTKFQNCTVEISNNGTKLTLTINDNYATYDSTINIGDILFNYTSNQNLEEDRKATVKLTQLSDSEITHVYTFTQSKNELIKTRYSNFTCQYEYCFDSSITSGLIEGDKIDGQTGGTLVVSADVSKLTSYFTLEEEYQSGEKEYIRFKFIDVKNSNKELYSGYTSSPTGTPSTWDSITNFNGFLDDLTKVLKSENTEGFYGFSVISYEKESTYEIPNSSEVNYSNITYGPTKGQYFNVTVGRNPNETTERIFNVNYQNVTGNNISCIYTKEGTDPHYFEYTQESGYTADIRRFVIKIHDMDYNKSIPTSARTQVLFNEIGTTARTYVYNSSGITYISNTMTTTPNSEWGEFHNEGSRPYPEIDEPKVVKTQDGDIYPASASGDVCTYYTPTWKLGCIYTTSASSAYSDSYLDTPPKTQDECGYVAGLNIVDRLDSGANFSDGDCCCYGTKMENCLIPGAPAGFTPLRVDFVGSTGSTGFTSAVTVNLSGTTDSKAVNIHSISGCAVTFPGTGTTGCVKTTGWYYYDEMGTSGACTDLPSCPCQTIDNSITGDTYDYEITFDFMYDYKKIKGQPLIVVKIFQDQNQHQIIRYLKFNIPNNSSSQIISLEGSLSSYRSYITFLNYSVFTNTIEGLIVSLLGGKNDRELIYMSDDTIANIGQASDFANSMREELGYYDGYDAPIHNLTP